MPTYSGGWHYHKAVPSSAYDPYQQDNEVLFGVMCVLQVFGLWIFFFLVCWVEFFVVIFFFFNVFGFFCL